ARRSHLRSPPMKKSREATHATALAGTRQQARVGHATRIRSLLQSHHPPRHNQEVPSRHRSHQSKPTPYPSWRNPTRWLASFWVGRTWRELHLTSLLSDAPPVTHDCTQKRNRRVH